MPLSLALLGLSLLAQTQAPATDITLPPATAQVDFSAQGKGMQIYTCAPQGIAFEWILKAPDATLTDANGQQIGTHSAGPTWTATDGSSITGKVLHKRVSPDPLSIYWLLLAATPAPGHPGTLANVAFVRRSETIGGVAPADGCDAQHPGAEVRIPYTATYTFYSSK